MHFHFQIIKAVFFFNNYQELLTPWKTSTKTVHVFTSVESNVLT